MRIYNKMHIGRIEVVDDTRISGQVVGDVTVRTGAKLEVPGQIIGNFRAERGAVVQISGQMIGRIEDLGADMTITGMIMPTTAG